MIIELQDKISQYINKTVNPGQWKDIRIKYFEYSYLAFMCLCAKEIEKNCTVKKIGKLICESGIEEKEIIEHILRVPDAEVFMTDILELSDHYPETDLNTLYQGYLSGDYSIIDGRVVFGGGKNSRDILGSYYTQENFANEITKKTIEDYFAGDNKTAGDCVKIADYSCGGGVFLTSAYRLCKEKNVQVKIYGYDVDPIAVLITRLRLYREMGSSYQDTVILLGNPLIRKNSRADCLERFKLAADGRFYNVHMGITAAGNMDIVVGNPPWEKIRFEEKKFLNHYVSKKNIRTRTERESYIEGIAEENKCFYQTFVNDYDMVKKELKKDPFFSNSSCGELNTYALFTEFCFKKLRMGGVAGLIVKSSLVKMPVYSNFFRKITKDRSLYEVYMFVNRKRIFNIDSREEFSVIYLKAGNEKNLRVALNLDSFAGFYDSRKIELTYELLNILNPDTGMIPNISSNEELQFLIKIYKNNPTFGSVYPECKFGRLVHLTNHSSSIKKNAEEGYSPVYEGKFIELYTGKYATFAGMRDSDKYKNKATANAIMDIDGKEYPEARFYIRNDVWSNLSKNFDDGYIIAWRSLTSATNRRTMLATLLPLIPTCQSIQLLQLPVQDMLHVLAVFNSIVFDYIIRLKMAGLDLTQTMVKQMPIPNMFRFDEEIEFMGKTATIGKHVDSRLKWVYSSDSRVKDVFDNVEVYDMESGKTRKQIIAELDKIIAIAYGVDAAALKQIALSFVKYYTKEEVENWF